MAISPPIEIEKRSPELAQAMIVVTKRLKRLRSNTQQEKRRRILDEYDLIRNFCALDLMVDMETRYGVANRADSRSKEFLSEQLPDLQALANRDRELASLLRGYLPRLEELCGRAENLRGLYKAYRQALGGNS